MGGGAGRGASGGQPFDAALDAAIGTSFYQSPVAMVCIDLQLRLVRVNEVFCRLLGMPAEQMLGLRPSEYSGGFDGEFIERVVTQQVLDKGAPLVDARLSQRMADGRERNLAWSAFLILDDGRPLAVFGMLTDVTERMRTVRALERAHTRLDLLERAGSRVGATLDVRRTAAELAQLAVPALADRFSVDLLDRVVSGAPEDAREGEMLLLRRVAVRDVRPERRTKFAEGDLITAPLTGSSLVEAMNAGSPILMADLTRFKDQALYNPGEAERLLAAGIHSFLIVPMIARGVTLGVAGFARTETQEPYTEEDLQLGVDIVARAAISIDNARMYTSEHVTALTLQQSLLPVKVPRVPGLVTAHRYRAVSNAAQVGGDWFDVIPLEAGKVALVVGDVTGHDIHAAAVMGQLRTTVANLAPLGLEPGEIMNRLTQIVADHGDETGATCVCAVYDPSSRLCRFTVAGHPPPVLLRPDGTVEFVDAPNGPMLGLTQSEYDPVDVYLPPGSTLALYTDGLVEKPDQDFTAGMDRLAAALAASPPDQPLGELSDHILASLGPYSDDDVALLLARTDTRAEELLVTGRRSSIQPA